MFVRVLSAMADVRDRGASGVEYGIMIAAVAAVIVVAAFAIGSKIGVAFDDVNAEIP